MDLGLSLSQANKAYMMFGTHALSHIRNDPYQLFTPEDRIPWRDIDAIAEQFGFRENSPERISGAIRYSLIQAMSDGHVYLPCHELYQRTTRILGYYDEIELEDTLSQLQNTRTVFIPTTENGLSTVYLYPMFRAERNIAHRLQELYVSSSRVALKLPKEREIKKVEEELGIHLAEAQREAISASLGEKMVILTGGPGTGKTTIIHGVLKLWEKRGAKIRLAAPTGRASRRLSESTGRKALTIHRMLEYNPEMGTFSRHAGRRLEADLLVIDEASMIDTELMSSLLDAISPSAHLLLVGDVNQLPAVGPGLVLHELIESGLFKTIHLTDIYRQEDGSLISLNAKKINEGQKPDMEGIGIERGQDFFFIERQQPEAVREAILEMTSNRIPRQLELDPKLEVQVLCPMIKKDLGVEKMNEVLQEKLNPADLRARTPFYSVSIGDKIMQTRNDYSKDVFNGDIGYVVDIQEKKLQLIIRFDGVDVRYSWKELENTTLAYAITVHKSQGSEYPAVVIPLVMQHYPMLQRNLLYTAVSRGKQMVILVGNQRALDIAISNNKIRKRFTNLRSFLQESFQKSQKT